MSDPLEEFRNVPRPATPGPWKQGESWGEANGAPNGLVYRNLGESDHAWPRVAEAKAPDDARAIAALPDTLDKLDRLVRYAEFMRGWLGPGDEDEEARQRGDAILRGEA